MSLNKDSMIRTYDGRMQLSSTAEFYGGTRFYNFGYWADGTKSQKEACETLMDRLLSFVPRHEGRVLDVACGLGATTECLGTAYDPGSITGVNISEKQVEICRAACPNSRFEVMDATNLAFDDNTFDAVFCVEAAFHFNTRQKFLAEACRVLKPGGHLVLTDILVRRWAMRLHRAMPLANCVESIDAYRPLYAAAGFGSVQIEDATVQSWSRFSNNLVAWQRQQYAEGKSGIGRYLKARLRHFIGHKSVLAYLLVAAEKTDIRDLEQDANKENHDASRES